MPPKKTNYILGKRSRKDNSDLVPSHQKESAKRLKLEEDTFFRILDVPTDIFHEICSHLHPLGLLRLSRTCKTIRATLMSIASRYAWRSSFESIMFDGIREVCDDICEPRLATMLFENRCDGCQKSRRTKPQFMLRVNMCRSCLWHSPDFIRHHDFYRESKRVTPNYDWDRLSRIGTMLPHALAARDHRQSQVYNRTMFLAMIQETKDLTDDEFATWCEAEKENFEHLEYECEYLCEFQAFMDKEASSEDYRRRAAIHTQRKNDIAALFLDAGYVTTRPDGSVDESFWVELSSSPWEDPRHECWRMATRDRPLTDKEWAKGDILRSLIDCGAIIHGEKLSNILKKKERARERARERRAAKRRANE